jgi:hypothetical protein
MLQFGVPLNGLVGRLPAFHPAATLRENAVIYTYKL